MNEYTSVEEKKWRRDYKNIEAIDFSSKNNLFKALDQKGNPVFIKEYVVRPNKIEKDLRAIRSEITCYREFSEKLYLPNLIKHSIDDQYLVLPFQNYKPAKATEITSKLLLEIIERFRQIDATNLIENVDIERMKKKYREILSNSETVVPELKERKEAMIEKFDTLTNPKVYVFSHGDFMINNLVQKIDSSEVFAIDYEGAILDSPMRDPAYMWLSLWKNPRVRENFLNELGSFENFDRHTFWMYVLYRVGHMIYFPGKRGRQEKVDDYIEIIDQIIK